MKNLLVALALYMTFTVVASETRSTQLTNDQLCVQFDATTGSLEEFSAPGINHQFINAQPNSFLWELEWSSNSAGDTQKINANAARTFHFERKNGAEGTLIWENFGLAGAPELRVLATVVLDSKKPLSQWTLSVKNSGSLRFSHVRFPCIQNIRTQTNEFFAAPVWIGQLATNPRETLNGRNGREWRYEYPGHASMQCFALYKNNGPGLYFSCDDTNAFHKSFHLAGDGKGSLNFFTTHLPETSEASSGDYSQGYSSIIGAFSGDWLTAAEIYREWGTNQWWAKESRLKKKEKNWARETALWVWNRGTSENVIEPAIALQKELGLPVSAMWHWWHGCAYDIGFPEYLPPREGSQSFSAALTRAHEKDVHAIVYMNQRLWGMTTRSWETKGATNFAVLGTNGKVHPEIYNTFTKSPCASMCMGTGFWRNYYAGLTAEAFGLGVDGIYMDQACSSLACYSPNHGHPPGGGTYWMRGFRDMATDIRARAGQFNSGKKSKAIALAGEGVGESWLPYLDLMLSLQVSKERYAAPDGWEPIPFFQAVYHPFTIQYGNYSSLTMPPYDELWPKEFAPKEPLKLLDQKFSKQFYLEQARAFVWGQQPTIANFRPSHLKERPDELAYVLQLAKLRSRTLKYLQDGKFIRTPEMTIPTATIPMSRLSIYAGQQGGLTAFEKEVPQVLAGTWQSSAGTTGLALASISDETIPLKIHFRADTLQLPHRGSIYRIEVGNRRRIGTYTRGVIDLPLTLKSRVACVLEFVP